MNTASISLQDALSILSTEPVLRLAGGTDYYPALEGQTPVSQFLDIKRIDGLKGISRTEKGWSIGAATTWTDIVKAPLPRYFDGLKAAAREVGSIQIQNAATLAGNLCNASPAADGVPPLLALNARVALQSCRGNREIALNEFIQGPRHTLIESDELLVAVHIPYLPEAARSHFVKLGSRRFLVISIVMGSALLVADEQGVLQDVRISVGACSAVAQRLTALEQALKGQSVCADLQSLVSPELFGELTPIADVRGSVEYRLHAAEQVVRQLLAYTLKNMPDNGAQNTVQNAVTSEARESTQHDNF